uniref:Uncharacterized protein n=1 Tax=Paramoeba perurans TaxID=437603 RepID=A0A8E8PJU0_9EUKA|nr:hypothetical protein [Paramoeba perurans]WQA41794.1 hypothetical protein [Paramoeba perurans]
MRVLLVVLAIVGLASAGSTIEAFPQNPIEAPIFPLGDFPWYFCHSFCTFSGEYDFSRFWAEPDPDFVDDTHIFDWSVDGDSDFWSNDCDDTIEYYRYPPTTSSLDPSESELRNCQPTWIYIENVEITYDRFKGWFHWTHRIQDAYSPSEESWSDWSNLAADAKLGNNIGDAGDAEYDQFDGLFRYYPDPDDSSLTSRFENDYYYRESYIANYEPNYCTMQMPHNKIDQKLWCNGNIQDDSDETEFPTRSYCLSRGAWIDEDDSYRFGCDGDSDDCDSIDFFARTSRTQDVVRVAPSKTEKLLQATRSSRTLAHYEKRGAPYDLFYYQNDVAGVQFPYCAQKD